ncbi:hypothetical protein AX15_001725 [Amanita polypyramis BW_CC]|nr:hypothetical protein AX15_001725 [Amanita polypyramis BW_CC]
MSYRVTVSRLLSRFSRSKSHSSSLHHNHNVPISIEVTVQTRSLPLLPVEVWQLIFRFATSDNTRFTPIDFPANTSLSNEISFLDFPHSHCDTDIRLTYYLRSLKQKLDLLLVCKYWATLALEVLYDTIWIYKPHQAHALAKSLTCQKFSLLPSQLHDRHKGRHVRRLHIETPTLERCSPKDLRIILDNTPNLAIFSDYRSVRRNVYAGNSSSPTSPCQFLRTIAHPHSNLRRLSWTIYDDVSFHLKLSSLLANVAHSLEFLELTFNTSDIHKLKTRLTRDPGPPLHLSSLRSLKVSLDNATLAVLSAWHMPVLKNVSIVSPDFSHAGEGFCAFFRNHGHNIEQLELGHSASVIEEHYLTIPADPPTASTRTIRLAEWCPNLREFVCSADVEWNWQTPDWVAPHVLLPAHPKLQLIGIRDLDKRVYDDMAISHANPFFPLLSQIETMLSRKSFPELRYIRDLSFESDVMRSDAYSSTILDFWADVVEMCRRHNAWLESYTGINISSRDIMRYEARAMVRKMEEEERNKKRGLFYSLVNN